MYNVSRKQIKLVLAKHAYLPVMGCEWEENYPEKSHSINKFKLK